MGVSLSAPITTWLRDVLIGLACAVVAFAARMVIEHLWLGVILFPLVYPAITAATLLASWRAGLVALLSSQLAIWYFLMPIRNSFALPTVAAQVSLILATAGLLLLLWMVHMFKVSRSQLLKLNAQRIADLELAMEELDHRTMNNFQLAMAILQIEAKRVPAGTASDALESACNRLGVLASVHKRLKRSNDDLRSRDLAPLIEEILVGARVHAETTPLVSITADLKPVQVPPEHAVRTGLIANELVTNALKYAFPDGRGNVHISLSPTGAGYRLEVTDNGVGRATKSEPGSGSRLMPKLASANGGKLVYTDGPGTKAVLEIPDTALADMSIAR